MLLSCKQLAKPFPELFEAYSQKETLMAIAEKHYGKEVMKELEEKKWAPADL